MLYVQVFLVNHVGKGFNSGHLAGETLQVGLLCQALLGVAILPDEQDLRRQQGPTSAGDRRSLGSSTQQVVPSCCGAAGCHSATCQGAISADRVMAGFSQGKLNHAPWAASRPQPCASPCR